MPTAWGEIIMSIGTPGAGEIMSTTLTSLGNIKEESVSLETEDGNVYQLFGTGHVLLDQLKNRADTENQGYPCRSYKCDPVLGNGHNNSDAH